MSDEDTSATDETEVQDTDAEQDSSTEDERLGDAGKKALDAWKDRARLAEKALKDAKVAAAKAQQEADLKDKPADEQEIERARAEARAEATAEANKRILRSELKALATGKLADPTDAALYVNLDDFTVSDSGDVDSDALNEAIADLIERKPHLAAQKQSRFDGAADQGAKGKDSKPSQLTKDDIDSMSPEQIVAAQADGRLDKVLGITR